MKRLRGLWLAGMLLAGVCQGQSVVLKVLTLENSKRTTDDGSSYYTSRKEIRSQTIKITLTNMHTNAFEYVVEWFFLGKSAAGGGGNFVYDAAKQTMKLGRAQFDSWEVTSKEIKSSSSDYGDGYRSSTGEKPDGYVVVVWAKDKIVGVEASDMSNRRKYTTPKEVKKLEVSYRKYSGKKQVMPLKEDI